MATSGDGSAGPFLISVLLFSITVNVLVAIYMLFALRDVRSDTNKALKEAMHAAEVIASTEFKKKA